MLGLTTGAAGPPSEGDTALACSSPKGLVGSEKGFSTFSLAVLALRSQALASGSGMRLRPAAPLAAAAVGAFNRFPWLRRCPMNSGMRRLIGRKSSVGAEDA
jgi:hypothetical protein